MRSWNESFWKSNHEPADDFAIKIHPLVLPRMTANTDSITESAFTRDPSQRTLMWKALQGICRIATSLMFELKVYGKQHIPPSGGVLIVANHQSYLDPIVLAVQLYRPVSFLAKSELFKNAFFGWLIRNLNAFPVRQGAGDVGAMKETIRRLQQGHMLVIYPEGSRSDTGDLLPIASGAALVIRRAGVPVVPAIIEGSFQAWPRSHRLFRPHQVAVLYGPALQTDGLKAQEITALIDRTFHAMRDELRQRMQQDIG